MSADKVVFHLNSVARGTKRFPSAPFLPHLFRQGGKDGAAGGLPSVDTANTVRKVKSAVTVFYAFVTAFYILDEGILFGRL